MNSTDDRYETIGTVFIIVIIIIVALFSFRYARYNDEMTLCNNYQHNIQQQ